MNVGDIGRDAREWDPPAEQDMEQDVEQDVEQMVRHDAEEADYRTPLASREASPLLWEAVSDNFWRAKLAGAQVGFVVKANTSPRLGEWEATTTAPYAASSLMTRHHKLDAAKAAVAARIQDGFAPFLRAVLPSPRPAAGTTLPTRESVDDMIAARINDAQDGRLDLMKALQLSLALDSVFAAALRAAPPSEPGTPCGCLSEHGPKCPNYEAGRASRRLPPHEDSTR